MNCSLNNPSSTIIARLYLRSRPLVRKLIVLIEAIFTGFWLGVLGRETLYRIDQHYYDCQKIYRDVAYNRRGLWPWEEAALKTYFQASSRLLVTSVGGGREVLALRQRGYEVDGFECHPDLVQQANGLLEQAGFVPNIHLTDRDQCPPSVTAQLYDGIIIGWGAYMLIQGQRQRVTFLRQVQAQIKPEAPILLSFFHRTERNRRFKFISAFGNIIRRLLRRDLLQPGDALVPNYVHHFTRDEIQAELHQAGFDLVHYATDGYGHAVGLSLRRVDVSAS